MTAPLDALLDQIAHRVAELVLAKLRAADMPGYVDQTSSPLGRRRHIQAVRSGQLPGIRVGRRYLATRENVDEFVASQAGASVRHDACRDSASRSVDDLATQLGFVHRRRPGGGP